MRSVARIYHTELSSHPSVLYIDDDASNLRLVEYVLEGIDGLRFIAASNGEHGLRLARQLRPNVILLDLGLPDIDGGQVLRRLRSDPPTARTPVVIVSGGISELQRSRLTEDGVARFLDKPYAIDDMIAVVEDLLGDRGDP